MRWLVGDRFASVAMNEPAAGGTTAPEGPAPGWLQAAGVAVGLLLGFVTAIWEAFASPLYAGGVPLPVSPVLAVASNLALVWFTRRVTGRTGLALLPGVVWFGTMLVAASKTDAGSLLIPGNDYMGLAAILLGSAAWGVGGYWAMLRQRPGPTVKPIAVLPAAPKPVPAPNQAPGAKPRPPAKAKSAPAGGRRRSAKPSGR
jgi:hypothetical protein